MNGKVKIVRHELKILPEQFESIESNKRTFDIRENDRGFAAGDEVMLREFFPGNGYTGNKQLVHITYVTDFQQAGNYVVFSFIKMGG